MRARRAIARFPARSNVTGRMADFMVHRRDNGLPLGVADTAQALTALGHVTATNADEVCRALKALCTGNADDFARFDDLFAAFWYPAPGRTREGYDRSTERATDRGRTGGVMQLAGAGRADAPDADGAGEAEQDGTGRLTGSRIANLMKVDLREIVTTADMQAAEATATRLARAIRDRRSRRKRAAPLGETLDLRRIIRTSLATGGEPMHLHRRQRPDRPVRLVALCDVSGSMAVYARVFLAFLKGLMAADLHADAYLFHTRLVRITEALRDTDPLRAVNRMSLLAQGFGGGTRIGGNLAAFNAQHARRAVNARSVVLILSDGCDTDPPETLALELTRLKKRGCRIIWLNPLKGWRGYAPVVAGMAAALPHLDLFAAANTLESLAALEPQFARL
ncbi:MAG: vWA domain-containing protein [Paracoccaceae bacterium]